MRRWLFVLAAFSAAGCGRYADFTLPASPGPAREILWRVREPVSGPVVGRGTPGDWDASDVLNPSVIHGKQGYFNLYSGFDGRAWHTGLAVSPDGLHWSKRGRVFSPDPGGYIAANGALLERQGEFLYWFQEGRVPRISLARSRDGREWRKVGEAVLNVGPRGSWDERGVADPYVIELSGRLYMFYLGQDRARRQRLGVAVSDDGIVWTKLRSNPILELGEPGAFDEAGLGEPAVWEQGGWYWMLYTGRDAREYRRIGLARSREGVSWTRVTTAPIFTGSASWNSKVACDPTVLVEGGVVRVWYGGGDVARPDERLNGQIGYFKLVEGGGE